jgi:DNA-binding LacI/PurR family transcriptional regulator
MAKTRRNPSLDDLDAHSGVSAATVSRVLNRSGSVSRELVTKVNQSLRTLGFEPDTRGYLAVLAADLTVTMTGKIAGVYSEAERLGYVVVILHTSDSPEVNERNLQLCKILKFDALIVLRENQNPDELREKYELGTIPIVVVNHRVDLPTVHCIDVDRVAGMYKAAKHLTSLGHRRIAYLSAPLDTSVALDRKTGIDRAMEESGASCTFRQADASVESGFQMTSSLLAEQEPDPPTAIIAFDDMVAVGSLEALKSLGRKVPEEMSLIGFNDQFITRHTSPPLTTVHQPWVKMGQLAVSKIDGILSSRDSHPGGLTLLEGPLIVRESTGPVPKQ